jgi:hypothetical protein
MPTLAELKKLVKEHQTDKPRLSAGKEALLIYAEKAGLLKKPEVAPPAEPKVIRGGKKTEMPLPEVLKKSEPVEKKVRILREMPAPRQEIRAEVPAVKEKKVSAFSAFISANKGSGHNMKELAEMYKSNK